MTGLETAEVLRRPPGGLLRFEPGRDLRGVIELLRIGFGPELSQRDLEWLDDLESLASLGRLLDLAATVFPPVTSGLTGFVWYEDGRIVGNASLIGSRGTHVVANVVTRPGYRRRGIASTLMRASIAAARSAGSHELRLQVREGNVAAHELYDRLGFRRLGARALMRRSRSRGATRHDGPGDRDASGSGAEARVDVAPWGPSSADEALALLVRSGHLDGSVSPGIARRAADRSGLRHRLDDLAHVRRTVRLAAVAGGRFRGVAVARVATSGAHEMEIVVDRPWRGRVEPALVDAALGHLHRPPFLPVEADIDTRESGALEALDRAGFTRQRTLELRILEL